MLFCFAVDMYAARLVEHIEGKSTHQPRLLPSSFSMQSRTILFDFALEVLTLNQIRDLIVIVVPTFLLALLATLFLLHALV